MRRVYEHGEETDETPGQKALRKLLVDKPDEFISRLERLEKQHRARALQRGNPPATEEPPEADKEDEGTRLAIGLCEDFLAKYAAKQAREDAELAARPNAAEAGRGRQEELRAALSRERMLREELATLERDVGEQELDGIMRAFSYKFHDEQANKDDDLACSPNPATIIGSMEKALQNTLQREGLWQKRVEELKSGVTTKADAQAALHTRKP